MSRKEISFCRFGFSQDIRRGLESNVNVELLNALHSHMVNKRMLTKDLKNGMIVPSMYNNLGLFINHYPNGVSVVSNRACLCNIALSFPVLFML